MCRAKFKATSSTAVRRYVGNWYRDDSRTRNRPENMLYAFVATMLPGLVFDNPAVTVTAKRSISYKDIARYMANGLQRMSPVLGGLGNIRWLSP